MAVRENSEIAPLIRHPSTPPAPTQDLIRQVLGVVVQFEKANLVSKLKAVGDRQPA